MAKYPFLPQARKLISILDFDFKTITEIPLTRERAKQRISASYDFKAHFSKAPSNDARAEVASYALALAYASGIGDPKMIERFALYEADLINDYLRNETREEVIIEIAKSFGWEVRAETEKGQHLLSIPFAKFLENSTRGRLHHDPKWKLVNRALVKGYVRVNPFEIARLLQEEVMKKIQESAKIELTNVPEQMQKDIDELKAEFLKMKPALEEFDQIVRANESEYPPCIKALLERAAKGLHMSHVERFTLVTYLLHQGISIDSVVNLFAGMPDFNPEKTKYQIENLAGKQYGTNEIYVTYNCASLQTHGVCSGPVDQICRTIRNPLTYHLRKQRMTN